MNKVNENTLNNDMILFKSISTIEKYNFYEYLAVMIDAGVSISESLNSFIEKTSNPYLKEKIMELKVYIDSWDYFSKSMRKIPQVFNSGEIAIIEAGETTGKLVSSLQKLSDDLKKLHALKQKVKWALTYPIMIFLFLILAVVIVLSYVIPKLIPLFETAEVTLPWATVALISTSNFFINNYLFIIFVLFSLIVSFFWYSTTISWKNQINNFLLQMPLIWKVYQNYTLANISSSLWTLIWSGVSIIKALKLTWKASGNSLYESLFDQIIERVLKGSKIVEAMEDIDKEKKYFPVDFVQMLSVWEKTAKLEEINKKINAQYLREVDYSLNNMTKWIEPIAILFAAWFVLWFAFAIFGAILKVTQTVW